MQAIAVKQPLTGVPLNIQIQSLKTERKLVDTLTENKHFKVAQPYVEVLEVSVLVDW